jgi:hypothetical protein
MVGEKTYHGRLRATRTLGTIHHPVPPQTHILGIGKKALT